VDTPEARAALRIIVTSALADNNPPRPMDEVRAAHAALDREAEMGHGGKAAAPGYDREPFDAEAIYQEDQEAAVSFGGFTDGVLSPLPTLSFWTMKDRARRSGETGARADRHDPVELRPRRGDVVSLGGGRPGSGRVYRWPVAEARRRRRVRDSRSGGRGGGPRALLVEGPGRGSPWTTHPTI
jgi:hypothetical protein